MNKESIKKEIERHSKDYNTDNTLQEIEDLLYDHELEIGNIICIFTYKKEDHLELSFLTSPNKNLPRININKR
jgi:hypothetical protein